MKIVCIDYGKSRIGIAASDLLGILATPVGTVHEKFFPVQIEKVAGIVKEQNADKLLIGLPLNMDGTEGGSAALVREFAEKLAAVCAIPCEFIDERLSTVSAHRAMNDANMSGSKKRRSVVDTISAVILLQAYLDK